jgi:hypothetical protein
MHEYNRDTTEKAFVEVSVDEARVRDTTERSSVDVSIDGKSVSIDGLFYHIFFLTKF